MALILIVEDEVAVAEVIVDALSELNHESRVALTADDALAIATMDRPAVILLDVNLPDSSGTSTLDRLRELRPDVPVIMVSGNADEELARETLQRGAFDYVVKPFDLNRLTRLVELALGAS
jgi:DNA-binding NtrC family response regulator